jgi:hypothetical protein
VLLFTVKVPPIGCTPPPPPASLSVLLSLIVLLFERQRSAVGDAAANCHLTLLPLMVLLFIVSVPRL